MRSGKSLYEKYVKLPEKDLQGLPIGAVTCVLVITFQLI